MLGEKERVEIPYEIFYDSRGRKNGKGEIIIAVHLFWCPGYQDLITDDIWYNMFWDDNILKDISKMKKAASILMSVIERLELIQKMAKRSQHSSEKK